jgi:threonylcarbamoyladenosine tRNA methylthiotransferase MtaB
VPAEALIDAILALCAAGVNEVVLTGIDTSGYGADLPGTPSLGGLIQAILAAVPALARLRLSSLDAAEADPALIEAFADKRLMPHIHLSLQSGSNLILKRMKRRHSREDAIRLVETLRHVRPDIAIGADLIAGFPTEAEADHLASLALLDDCDIVHAHIFPYSERPGTIAARMPQVQKALRRARAADLRAAASARHLAFLARHIGRPLETVSEGAQGYAPDYAAVRYREPMPRGALVPVTPRGLDKETLLQ